MHTLKHEWGVFITQQFWHSTCALGCVSRHRHWKLGWYFRNKILLIKKNCLPLLQISFPIYLFFLNFYNSFVTRNGERGFELCFSSWRRPSDASWKISFPNYLYDMINMNGNVTIPCLISGLWIGWGWLDKSWVWWQSGMLGSLWEGISGVHLLVIHELPCSHELIGIFPRISFDSTFSVYFLILRVWVFTPFGVCFTLKEKKRKLLVAFIYILYTV